MSQMKSAPPQDSREPIEQRIGQHSRELERLLSLAPKQQCRPEGSWNEGDDFIQGFTDIWGDQG